MYIPPRNSLPLAVWNRKYKTSVEALDGYYDALSEHICLVNQYGSKLGVSVAQLAVHDKSKWGKHEFPFYADRFHGTKVHNKLFISAMNHHYAHNMHHPEYWITQDGKPYPMPREYIIEMIADWQAASFQYTGSDDIQKWLDEKLNKNRFHSISLDILDKELKDIGYNL